MYAIPTPKYNTICGCMKNDSGVSDKWFEIFQLSTQISKTLSSNDVIKIITTNLMVFQTNQTQILLYEYC